MMQTLILRLLSCICTVTPLQSSCPAHKEPAMQSRPACLHYLHAVSKTAQPAKLIPILSMHFLGQGTLLHKRDQTHSPLYKTNNVKSEKQNLEPGFSGLGSDLFFRQHLKKIVWICSRDPP